MKPYYKTYRVRKDHKASRCSLCRERVADSSTYIRRNAKEDILKELIIYIYI